MTRHASLDIDISRGRWGAVGERKEDWIWAVEGAVFAYKEGSIYNEERECGGRKTQDCRPNCFVLFGAWHERHAIDVNGGRDRYR